MKKEYCVENNPKPPIGVKPYYIEDGTRMKELSDTISRYIDYSGDYNTPKAEKVRAYEDIAKWAYELKMRAEVEVKLIEEGE